MPSGAGVEPAGLANKAVHMRYDDHGDNRIAGLFNIGYRALHMNQEEVSDSIDLKHVEVVAQGEGGGEEDIKDTRRGGFQREGRGEEAGEDAGGERETK